LVGLNSEGTIMSKTIETKTKSPDAPLDEHESISVEAIQRDFRNHLKYTLAKDKYSATHHDRYYALAMTVRDRLVERWIQTSQTYYKKDVKRVYYLSMEYLMGRALGNNVINLGMEDEVRDAMQELGLDWNSLRDFERDAGLGNGGLGRLAACFLDSLATLELPGYGYGLRYDYGIFRQVIRDGFQVEEPDNWLRFGYPWEIERPEFQLEVHFGGEVQIEHDNHRAVPRWIGYETAIGVPYDVPIAGFGNNTVNNLRLWTAKATEEFDLEFFNNGDYVRAYEAKMENENISKVLYPNDKIDKGKELRFKQQYFFVSCSLQDIVRRFKVSHQDFSRFPERVAIQLNDTHPAISIAEIMRIFLDLERMEWDEAWNLTTATFGYTNHTLMPEALETWSVRLFEQFLPRHITIIYEINRRFLRNVLNKFPNDHDRVVRMSLIQEGHEKQVRMAYLSVVGSHSVNGVAGLHSELIKQRLFRDFYEMWPEKFNNKTNGITQRRWLLKCNPALASLITDRIGDGWIKDLSQFKQLESLADDATFQKELMAIKRANKVLLAELIERENGVPVDPDSLFVSQVKRLHEYKRQVLNVMHILHRYAVLKANKDHDYLPRTFIFSAKAAPGYALAKLIIKLINDVAGIINHDPEVNDKLRVVFLADYRVSLAERIIPGTDLSEQISTAGTEASGTGNMKFQLNGALTIGTLDGANVEIREEVGPENFFLFGKTVEEIESMRQNGSYNPWHHYYDDLVIKRVMDNFNGDFLNLEQPTLYKPLWDNLLTHGDYYCHMADFRSYIEAEEHVDMVYRDSARWAKMCIMNIANTGKFSSDRTIKQYGDEIWGIKPCPIDVAKGRVS
jgi:starch phosphorylase